MRWVVYSSEDQLHIFPQLNLPLSLASHLAQWLQENDLPTLPPPDAVSGMFDSITSLSKDNLHPVLPLSDQAIIKYPYKLVTGISPYSNWTGTLFPNCTTVTDEDLVPWHNDSKLFEFHINWDNDEDNLFRHLWGEDCGESGCLFNIEEDPNETNNLAGDGGEHDEVAAELRGLLDQHRQTLFMPDRGVEDVKACEHSVSIGGYYGPWVDVEDYYTGPFRDLTLKQKIFSKAYEEFLEIVSHPRVEEEVFAIVQKIYPWVMRPYLVRSFDYCLPEEEKEGGKALVE